MSSYDIASTSLGVGAVTPGQACCILGTTLCTEVVRDTVALDGPAAGLNIALGVPGRYLRAFPTLAGTEVIQWACRMLGLTEPAELSELATGADVGAGGLTFLPYLSPAGERSPFLDPLARGSFLGLSLEHERHHVARAVLEGLTLVIQDCLAASGAEPTELRVAGGGAVSPVWLQLIADVTAVPVSRSTDTEAGARGAFLIGQVATGAADSVDDIAPRFVRARDTFHPDPVRSGRYRDLFADFLALRQTTATAWPRLDAMRHRAVR
jgi:xylulokinase